MPLSVWPSGRVEEVPGLAVGGLPPGSRGGGNRGEHAVSALTRGWEGWMLENPAAGKAMAIPDGEIGCSPNRGARRSGVRGGGSPDCAGLTGPFLKLPVTGCAPMNRNTPLLVAALFFLSRGLHPRVPGGLGAHADRRLRSQRLRRQHRPHRLHGRAGAGQRPCFGRVADSRGRGLRIYAIPRAGHRSFLAGVPVDSDRSRRRFTPPSTSCSRAGP